MVETLLTSSAALLETHSAFRSLFDTRGLHDTSFFDEGPQFHNPIASTLVNDSGSIDTTSVDPFLQGIEITKQSRYDAGLAKVWSGERGHRLLRAQFGMDRSIFSGVAFVELDRFDPKLYVSSSQFWNEGTAGVILNDFGQAETIVINGSIEPLAIRRSQAFSPIRAYKETTAIKAALSSGNQNGHGGSDQVTSMNNASVERFGNFVDVIDMTGGLPTCDPSDVVETIVTPFIDERIVRNVRSTTPEPSDIDAALSLMSGSTSNYLKIDQRSYACGWYYDNNVTVGTDSLAFGGMTY